MKTETGRISHRTSSTTDLNGNGIATVLDGQDVLPGFELKLWQIDEALSQDSSESEPSDDEDSTCPKCGQSFDNTHHLIEHLEEEHARRKRKPA